MSSFLLFFRKSVRNLVSSKRSIVCFWSRFRHKNSRKLDVVQWIFFLNFFVHYSVSALEMHFVTATDTEHYAWTLNLISGIQRFHPKGLGEIAVYDLGLTFEERQHLNSLSYVQVYEVEPTNPSMLLKFTVNNKGKVARGWYSWKPVVIKQAMDKHAEFFYLDSGITVLAPMDLLFKHLRKYGYFLIDCGHSIERMTPKSVIKKFGLDIYPQQKILQKKGISAGIQGLTRAVYDSYVLPVYQLCDDIHHFEDDGSCPKGFGWARHDQTLFSIQARLANLQVNEVIQGGKMLLYDNDKRFKVKLRDFMEITRKNFDPDTSKIFLKYKIEDRE